MKQVIFAMSLMALVSCKNNKEQEVTTETDQVEQVVEATKDHELSHHDEEASSVYENAWTNEITMNNGAKWQADAPTNKGVQQLQKTIKTIKTSTLDDYHKLAEQLNVDKNTVVKNCTMKGAPHDNLHVWLLPLMDKIEALSETETVEDASKIKQSIEANIDGYFIYFQ